MGVRVSRVLVVAALCAPWLTGCGSGTKPSEWWSKPPEPAQTAAPGAETTGSIAAEARAAGPAEDGELRGDPNSDLNLGKQHFREGNYGLAEVHFRRAVEKGLPKARDAAEAWLGLAASYDRLRRFELADRAYAQALKIVGPAPEILNNQGYSYIMRGDYGRARAKLNAAHDKDPTNPHILANLDLLEKSARPPP